jgi:hypothetical protein
MFYKAKVAVCSEIRTKHINPMWAPRRIFKPASVSYNTGYRHTAAHRLSVDGRFQASAVMYMRPAFFWDITQRRVVILYRRFGGPYHARLTGSFFWSACPRKLGLIFFPPTSVQNYHSTLRNVPEEQDPIVWWIRRLPVNKSVASWNLFCSYSTFAFILLGYELGFSGTS